MLMKDANIKNRIIYPFALAFFGLLTAVSLLFYTTLHSNIEAETIHRVKSLHQAFENTLSEKTDKLAGFLSFIVNDDALINAWQSRDRDKLLLQARSIYDRLNNDHRLTHIYFIDTDQTAFLRVHRPSASGDLIRRYTLQQAVKTGRTSSGLELDTFGELTLRVVSPVRRGKQLVGYVELGKGIEHLTPLLESEMGVNLLFMIKKQNLNYTNWLKARIQRGKKDTWSQFDDYVLAARYHPNIDASDMAILNKFSLQESKHTHIHDMHNIHVHSFKLDDKNYQASFLPLIDVSNANIGNIILLRDVTKAVSSMHRKLIMMVTSSIVIGIAILFVLAQIIGRVEQSIRRSRDALKATNKELELALEKANEAATTKAAFVANMSHEIRTPMNGVLGMLGLLSDTELNETQREYTEIAYQSGESLMTLLNDILDYSKIESGRLNLEYADFNLHDTIEDVISLQATNAHRKGLEIACIIDTDVPMMVRGDATRLRQVLNNLVSNAIKFTHAGEVIVNVHVNSRMGNNTGLEFQIKDTGIGIDSQSIDKIFDTFTQADNSTTRKYGGTGLGLTISRQISQEMGGDITVESTLHQGSVFTFTAVFKKSAMMISAFTPDAILKQHRALIVDDNATNRLVLETQLSSWGMSFDSVASGPEALACIAAAIQQHQPYDLVLLDMMMPEMDGRQVAQKINDTYTTNRPDIIMLTSTTIDSGDRHLSDLVNMMLLKPVRKLSLYNAILSLIDNRVATHDKKPDSAPDKTPIRSLTNRILIAEDNHANQRVIENMLAGLGYDDFDTVENGEQVLDALQNKQYDIILMDIQMPVMDGLETTRKIRSSQQSYNNIAICAMTANAMHGDMEKCLNAGMNDYLSKPIDLTKLRSMLSKWITSANVVDFQNSIHS